MSLKKILIAVLTFSVTFVSMQVRAELIGHWEFNDNTDSTGNFNDIVLQDGAVLNNGRLDLTAPYLQWANTVWADSGDLNLLEDKTMISWVELTSLTASTGSAMTIDSATGDVFNGLIWSENYTGQWQVGSSFGVNNAPLGADANGTLNNIVQVAATFDVIPGGVNINYYINGINVGAYSSPTALTWPKGDMEVIFGARHTVGTTTPIATGSGIEALIHEARLYDTVLTQVELQGLALSTNDVSVPLGGLMSTLLSMALVIRRKKA
jgi:hypothetical protein